MKNILSVLCGLTIVVAAMTACSPKPKPAGPSTPTGADARRDTEDVAKMRKVAEQGDARSQLQPDSADTSTPSDTAAVQGDGGASKPAGGNVRTWIKATEAAGMTTVFERDGASSGIPSGAKAYRTEGGEKVGDPIVVASKGTVSTESVAGEQAVTIRINLSFRDLQGSEVGNMIAFFRMGGAQGSYVVKTVLQSRYESTYTWGDIPGASLPTVTTIDLKTGEKIFETTDLEFIQSPVAVGMFAGTENYFSEGEVVCKSRFVRHFGTGMLVDEKVMEGALPLDLHPYEYVILGWPER